MGFSSESMALRKFKDLLGVLLERRLGSSHIHFGADQKPQRCGFALGSREVAEAVELAMGGPKGRHIATKVSGKRKNAGRTTVVASIQG